MSLLIIRCPFKPFLGDGGSDLSEDLLISKADEFSWTLLDETRSTISAISDNAKLVGNIESMPYAEKVLVLIPTMDVRLIEMKIPLVSKKKIQALLPGLLEEYLLGGAQSVFTQVLPPVAGGVALMRTVAVIDRAWFEWLTTQLAKLLSSQVRLLPDCFLLGLPQLDDGTTETHATLRPTLMYEYISSNIVWTVRLKTLLGSSWIEQVADMHQSAIELKQHLPAQLQHREPSLYHWQWLISSAQFLAQEDVFRNINLLPSSFRLLARPQNSGRSEEVSGDWRDRLLWQRPLRWLMYCIASLLAGFLMHLTWIAIADWRWTKAMQDLAIPYLSDTSHSAISSGREYRTPLNAIAHQITQDNRRSGLSSDADFSSLSKKLQQLNALYGGELVKSIHYNSYDMEFEIYPKIANAKSFSSDQLIHKARALDLGVTSIEGNRFRLSPYSGLGEN